MGDLYVRFSGWIEHTKVMGDLHIGPMGYFGIHPLAPFKIP